MPISSSSRRTPRRPPLRMGARPKPKPTPSADVDVDVGEAPVDPRYEDLWVQRDESIQIPDLASIDLDFDDRDE